MTHSQALLLLPHLQPLNLLCLCQPPLDPPPIANPAPLQLFECFDNSTGKAASQRYQEWVYFPDDHTIRLRANTSLCIDVDGYAPINDATIQLYECHTSDKDPSHQNQVREEREKQWRFTLIDPRLPDCRAAAGVDLFFGRPHCVDDG